MRNNIPLTNEQYESFEKTKFCYIWKYTFEYNTLRVKDVHLETFPFIHVNIETLHKVVKSNKK